MSYTYSILRVPAELFHFVKTSLREAEYDHAIHDDGKILDMHGIALVKDDDTAVDKSRRLEVFLAVGLDEYLGIAIAVDNLPRKLFYKAQRRSRHVDDDYLDGLWTQWKRGGILWLGTRTSQAEKDDVFKAVIDYAITGTPEE